VTAIGDAITSVLAETSAPRPFLKAIRALRHGPAEDAVLAVLPAAPAAALATLEAIGGPKAVSVLKEGLCGGQIAPHLRAVRHQALELLWHLTDDRQALLARLNPHDLPARIAADLGGPDERELALLAAHLDPDEPVAALVRLAANGGSVPVLTDLLSRIVADLAASAWDPAAAPDPVVPPEVLGALRDVGRRLYERKRIRPAALLDAETPDEAGDAFVASIALDLLDRPELSDGERAILLELLGRVPYARTTARVHPLLRHRDRQVRKHAIALIAGDPALSASVTLLTGADDVQTVRQALLALGKVRAVWACPAITACLDHPNMNIKKTAATVLAEAGTATAVPKLLFWLGSHDNTGFRTALVEALRAILGDAFAATVLSAAENAADDRARELLLRGLGRTLSAQVVQALIDQGSAAARVLAKLISNEPQATRTAEPWSVQFAMRVLDQPGDLTELRPMLSDWLRLAEARPDRRADILRLVTRFCPAPWSAAELEAVTSWKQVLVAGFDDVPELTGMLEAVAPALSAEQGLSVAATIRAKGRSALRLLRLSGAVLVRADLDQALACARLGPNPWLAEQAALRESFGVEPRTGAEPWAESLRTAARAPDLLRKFREQDDGTIGSRPRLDAMIEAFPAAGPEVRELLLDWMTALQPLGAPPWTLSEARREHEPAARPPRSAALRDRLLTKLADPDQTDRDQAARALQSWPEPEFQQLVLRAYLAGDVQIRITRAPLELDGARPDRVLDLIAHLDPDDRVALLPHVLTWWAQGSASARAALRYFPADVLAQSLQAGAWDLDDLLAKRPLLRTPELAETDRRLRAEGRDGLILVNGPLRDPDHDDHQTLARLLTRPEPLATPAGPSRAELFAIARDGEPEQIRRALSELAEHGPDPDLEALLGDLITHRSPRVRLHAHRISRRLLDQPAYLQQTMRLLADPLPDVVRSAIKTLAHARWKPAIPLLVELLDHSREPIRRAAADGLALIGRPAIPALTHTAGRARPDRRHLYDTVMARIII
jgi:HEAT repeat protein